jgi:hypothetical protein
MAVDAMKAGKYAGVKSRRPTRWKNADLVRTHEATHVPCMMLKTGVSAR